MDSSVRREILISFLHPMIDNLSGIYAGFNSMPSQEGG
jgi:hypothetical protein